MSRAYSFAVECYPVNSDEDTVRISLAIEEEMGCECSYWLSATEHEEGSTAYFDSDTATLCGGESDSEAHHRLKEALKKEFPFLQEVTTKWLCTEYQEWDSVYTWDQGDDDELERHE